MAAASRTLKMPWDIRVAERLAAWLFVAAALAFVVIGVRWFVRLPMFAVKTITIDGDVTHNSADDLRRHVLARLEGNVFTLDLVQAQRAFQTAPWVRRAIVRRVWPDRLHVTLEEHQAAAYWQQDDRKVQLVNTHGEVFSAKLDEDLPVLEGPEGSAAQVLEMHTRLGEVFGALSVTPTSVELSPRGAWRVELDNGARVELGRGSDDEVLARTRDFVATLPQLSARYQQAPLIYADLRHRDGYAVRLKGVETIRDPAAPGTSPQPVRRPL